MKLFVEYVHVKRKTLKQNTLDQERSIKAHSTYHNQLRKCVQFLPLIAYKFRGRKKKHRTYLASLRHFTEDYFVLPRTAHL